MIIRVTLNLSRTGFVNPSATFISSDTLFFEVVGQIQNIETFAYGSAIREIGRLRRQYGIAKWRKRKGIATVRLSDGTIRLAEVHWYEATGIGKFELKIKCYLD